MVSLTYALLAVLNLGVYCLVVPTIVARWVLGGWMPVESVDEPIDHMALTIAGIAVEEIWPDGNEANAVLMSDVRRQVSS